MSADFPVTIFHNPNCGTSRNVVAAVRDAGHEPEVVDYLKTGWTKPQLQALFAELGVTPREILRVRASPAEALGLLSGASDDAILSAMVEHPILVERPIVKSPKGVRLCRPADEVQALLP
jgi:arsenate reductase (glutaredoxin)